MKEEFIRIVPEKRSTLGGKLLVGIAVLGIGYGGYLARDQMWKRGYVSEEAKLQVVDNAIGTGLGAKILEKVPEKDRYIVLKKDFERLPVDKRWEFVGPTIDKMVEKDGSDNTVYKVLKDTFGRK